jgi:hypothetical protein
MPDRELIDFALAECARIGILDPAKFIDGTVIRVPKAYPVYDDEYPRALERIRAYLDRFENLQLVGRNGQHRYNNQDHSMVTAVYAAQNLMGAKHEIWDVNVDEQYHEQRHPEIRDRATPSRVDAQSVEQLVRAAFARYDPVALAGSLALTLGSGLFLATAVLLVAGGTPVGPNLSLLANYLPGYEVSWSGALLGFAEGVTLGGLFGGALAGLLNLVIELHAKRFLYQAQIGAALESVEGSKP